MLSASQSAAEGPRSGPSVADATGAPVTARIQFASPHEVKLIEATIDSGFIQYAPNKTIGNKTYTIDNIDQRLHDKRNVEVVAPYRKGCEKYKTRDERKLRTYRHGSLSGFRTSGVL